MQKTTDVILEQKLAQMGLRNEARAAEVIKGMGARYACHPTNVIRKDSVATRVPAAPLVLHRRGAK